MSSLLCFFSAAPLAELKQQLLYVEEEAQKVFVQVKGTYEALEQGSVCFFTFAEEPNQKIVDHLTVSLKNTNVDILYFSDTGILKNIKVAAFDMDSTLIQTEVINELATYADVEQQVADITAQAMRGEIAFNESFELRTALLRGVEESALNEIAQRLPFMPGLQKLFKSLNEMNIKTAIISGGFQYFADHLKDVLNADYAFANCLQFEQGQLTGKHEGKIVGPLRKQVLIEEIAQQENINIEQVLAAGDGANDLQMLSAAGVGIAFHAKPFLKERMRYSLDQVSLDAIAALLRFVKTA